MTVLSAAYAATLLAVLSGGADAADLTPAEAPAIGKEASV
jgi:hypothetical protein